MRRVWEVISGLVLLPVIAVLILILGPRLGDYLDGMEWDE